MTKRYDEIYRITFPVIVSQTGSNGLLTPAGLSDFLQEAAARHADQLGWGFTEMHRNNRAWFLRNLRFRYLKAPLWGVDVVVETWPVKPSGLVYQREFRVYDSGDKELASGSSGWLLVNLENKRPVMMDPQQVQGIHFRDESLFDPPFPSISQVTDVTDMMEVMAGYGMLDLNRHVNHVHYIRWITEIMLRKEALPELPFEANIKFQQEMLAGQEGRVEMSASEPGRYLIHVLRMPDNKEVLRAVISRL